jgi:hypothetical protein
MPIKSILHSDDSITIAQNAINCQVALYRDSLELIMGSNCSVGLQASHAQKHFKLMHSAIMGALASIDTNEDTFIAYYDDNA